MSRPRKRRSMLLGCAVLAALSTLASIPSPAGAKPKPQRITKVGVGEFVGDGCGTVSTATMPLPKGVKNVSVVSPVVGDRYADFFTELLVATVISADFDPAASAVTWTAIGSDDACLNPIEYADGGWETDDLIFQVTYTTPARVYYQDTKPRYKPRRLLLTLPAGALSVTRLHWRHWGSRRTVGSGSTVLNGTRHPVRIHLSRLRDCGIRIRYTKLRYSIAGSKVPVAKRGTEQSTDGC